MKIEIDEALCEMARKLSPCPLKDEDYAYFVDFLAEVGYATIQRALREHPELTFMDLVALRYGLTH